VPGDPRQHHYIPQCYLRGFSRSGSKKSKIQVIDLKRRKHFETISRNVGGIRDFNRVEIDGIDPNAIESGLSSFEGELATALKKFHTDHDFSGENRDYILNLIALLSVRSPGMRENIRGFHADVSEKIMNLALQTPERWESQVRQMKQAGQDVNEDIAYEEMKDFHNRNEYTIELDRAYHITAEMDLMNAVLPYLSRRKWMVLLADDREGQFISTDYPVVLSWNDSESVPPIYRNSPGHGMRETEVLFPVTRNVAISGYFGGREGVFDATREMVALTNTKMLHYARDQIYAPRVDFPFMAAKGQIVGGQYLIDRIVT